MEKNAKPEEHPLSGKATMICQAIAQEWASVTRAKEGVEKNIENLQARKAVALARLSELHGKVEGVMELDGIPADKNAELFEPLIRAAMQALAGGARQPALAAVPPEAAATEAQGEPN